MDEDYITDPAELILSLLGSDFKKNCVAIGERGF